MIRSLSAALFCLCIGSTHGGQLPTRNNRDIVGPEGIVSGPGTELYVTSAATGEVLRIRPDGRVELLADLRKDFPPPTRRAMPLGIVRDDNGDLYIAVQNVAGGAIVKLFGPSYQRKEIWKSHLGSVNGLAIDPKGRRLFVSDSGALWSAGMLGGRVWILSLADTKEARKCQVYKNIHFANGLAFSPKDDILYVSQTYLGFSGGRLTRIRLSHPEAKPEVLDRIDGWPDGLAWDPARNTVHVCLQKSGQIVSYTPEGKRQAAWSVKPGVASTTRVSPNQLAWTRFWKPNIASILSTCFGDNGYYRSVHTLDLPPPAH